MLTSSSKIWHVKNRDFFQLNWLGSDQWRGQRCYDGDFNSDSARLPCCLSKDPLKRNFLDICLTTFLEFVISEIENLWGWCFVSKEVKFKLDFKNSAENSGKFFCWWDNCIWIGTVKLSLLRKGYFSSAANVLTTRLKIWDVNNGDIFQLNWLGCDQRKDKGAVMEIWTVLRHVYHVAWFDLIKLLLCRFQQCWGNFTMLLVEGFSETRLFTHLSDRHFGVRIFGNTKSMIVIFFFKIFKIYSKFQKSSKKLRKMFLFLR